MPPHWGVPKLMPVFPGRRCPAFFFEHTPQTLLCIQHPSSDHFLEGISVRRRSGWFFFSIDEVDWRGWFECILRRRPAGWEWSSRTFRIVPVSRQLVRAILLPYVCDILKSSARHRARSSAGKRPCRSLSYAWSGALDGGSTPVTVRKAVGFRSTPFPSRLAGSLHPGSKAHDSMTLRRPIGCPPFVRGRATS